MSNVYGIALSGLNAARAGLSTTSNNISNSNTVGYNRQQLVQEARSATVGDGGFVGQGVDIDSIARVYSEFINSQQQKATSDASFYDAKAQQVTKLDSTIADDASGLSSALSGFFSAAQTLSTNPADLSARQNFLSGAETLAARFNALNDVMDDIRTVTNQKVVDTVQKINDASTEIAELNKRIVALGSQSFTKGAPNDLLDRRDKLIMSLAEQVQVTRVNLSDGSVNLFLSNGQPLVVKDTPFQLKTEVDPSDPQNLLVGNRSTINGQERLISFDAGTLGTGALAGFLDFREKELAQYQNTLGLLAAQVGQTVNSIQTSGVDLDGNAGTPLFTYGGQSNAMDGIARAVPNRYNSTINPTDVNFRSIDFSKVTTADYDVSIIAGQPRFRELGSGGSYTPATLVNDPAGDYYEIRDASGSALLSFTLSNTSPAEGDKFTLMPSREGARNLSVSLSNPALIAASSSVNPSVGNNQNILAINALQTSKVLFQSNGASGVSVSDGFNQLVSKIGNKTRELTVSNEARQTVLGQVMESRDALSGVNMDEEAANLIKYQQAYQASGRVISLSKEMFELVLGIFG